MARSRHKSSRRYRTLATVAVFAMGLVVMTAVLDARDPATAIQAQPDAAAPETDREHCLTELKSEAEKPAYRRALAKYSIPDLMLTGLDNRPVSAQQALDHEGPVMLNFIFTTCSTICPILSATFTQVKAMLGTDAEAVRFVSVTIDPEHDTPEALRRYAGKYHADADWQFLTGDLEDIVALQRAFDAYRGNKMSHRPVTFVRTRSDGPWLRIEGFPRPLDLVREYRALTAASPDSG